MTRHGKTGTPIYIRWKAMRQRCQGIYAPRGISVCPEWDDFSAFEAWALGAGFREDLTLDRIDNDQGYSPQNCRWVDMKVQNSNRRPRDQWKPGRQVIPYDEHPKIVERIRRGERVTDLAKEYGVWPSRIYEIRAAAWASTGGN